MVWRTLRRLRHPLRREDGQAAFEFLLMLPLFFLFFLMVIDFGLAMYGYVSVANAAREGARYGAVNCGDGSCSTADITGRVAARSGGFADAADVTVAWPDGGDRGDSVVVKITRNHDLLFFPVSWNIKSCADMRLEQRDNGVGSASGTGCD